MTVGCISRSRSPHAGYIKTVGWAKRAEGLRAHAVILFDREACGGHGRSAAFAHPTGYAWLAASLPSAAWAAAKRAIGTRNGEQET
jgi:hypothetical protein